MSGTIRTIARLLRSDGVVPTLRYAGARLIEEGYERRFGVRTRGQIPLESLGIIDRDGVWYAPTSYPGFFKAMRHVTHSGAFVDYGSGLGRILVAAASLPFGRVTGVELSESLAQRSRENVARARGLVCRRVEVVCANAVDWRVPEDVSVFHFYNPFLGATLRAVVADIARSLRQAPRRAWIVFAFPCEMEPLMQAGSLIPRAWQVRVIDELWPVHPVLKNEPFGGNCYRVYAIDSTVTAPERRVGTGAEAGDVLRP
jgi:hypothetical protein